jgi:transposase InsO family protein
MDYEEKRATALWRMSILGPLVSARLEHGDRRAYFFEIATRTHQRPDGQFVKLSARTVEAWYLAFKKGGFEALFPKDRKDQGKSRAILKEVAEVILKTKRERPRRSIRRIIRMLERAGIVCVDELSRSAVHRFLRTHGVSQRPLRGPAMERRSFLHEHAGDLWVGDALHGPIVIAPGGGLRKSYLLSQIDGATRYLPHSYFSLSEGAVSQEYGFKQAILKHGLPRAYYVDLGSAYIARSLVLICAELGIQLLHTGVKDCEAKGVIERWHRTWREEVEDELPRHPIPIADLNAKHWAWLSAEYHAREHDTTKKAPREHWLTEVEHLRSIPRSKNIDEVFLHRERRFVRKDGTVRFQGGFLDVRPELVGHEVDLRFDPIEKTPPRVFVDDLFVCDTVPLDRIQSSSRKRRRIQGEPEPHVEPSGLDPLLLIEREHYERIRPVGKKPNGRPDADPHEDENQDSED